MMNSLWSSNTPARFWLCQPDAPDHQWAAAIPKALPLLGPSLQPGNLDELLPLLLGEGQFGPGHWQLSSARRWYYEVKPLLPRALTCFLRRRQAPLARKGFSLGWPIEDRYVRFQWEVMRQLLILQGQQSMSYQHFWPGGKRFAFVLTHDIETAEGQAHVRAVADLDESFGFRSSFNFVPERYAVDEKLVQELRERGFEIGVHGLKHDGKLFSSHAEFMRRVVLINQYLREFGAVGFRSPLTHRHPVWMQALNIEYDSSFFDTDPLEPIPGGVMSIWPFLIGDFVELPLTLLQDYTLVSILREATPRLWEQKVDFIEQYYGMALVNTHPDYLKDGATCRVYLDFLRTMKDRQECWHALPREVAKWWRRREESDSSPTSKARGRIELTAEGVSVRL